MATTKTKAVAAKKPAVKKVGRSGQTAGAAKPVVTNKTKNTAVVNGTPCAIVEKPAKKVAAKKPVAAKSAKSVSPSATGAPNSSTQSAASSAPTSAKKLHQITEPVPKGRAAAKKKMFDQAQTAAMAQPVIDHIANQPKLQNSGISGAHASPSAPLFKKTTDETLASAPDGGKPEAIAAAITKAVQALNGTANVTRKDISRVVHREVNGSMTNMTTSVRGEVFAHVLTDAFVRADETLKEFPAHERSALRPFVTFFERFWGVIENRTDIKRNFDDTTFRSFLDENVDALLTHGEYARYSFACGARAIVHHTFAGTAVMTIAPNSFVAQLKRMPFADAKAVEEQAKRNPPAFSFSSSVPTGLSALVRCDVDQPGLSLMVLNRVFGDPIDYALHLGDTCLATSVETLLDYLVDKEAQVLRKAA
jgi:hypothetical protein